MRGQTRRRHRLGVAVTLAAAALVVVVVVGPGVNGEERFGRAGGGLRALAYDQYRLSAISRRMEMLNGCPVVLHGGSYTLGGGRFRFANRKSGIDGRARPRDTNTGILPLCQSPSSFFFPRNHRDSRYSSDCRALNPRGE